MKILITGGNGYIAKSLFKGLWVGSSRPDIATITRQDFDLTSREATGQWFTNKFFDVVIHTAISGGSRLKPDTWEDMDNNLKMYYNLLNCRNKFKKLIHFGSGAEIYNSESPYGLSKKVIAKSISGIDNFYNIRIFGVFDENEWDTRFIKANLKRYINKEPIQIHQDKYMDFFYMKDLVSLVEYYIHNNNLPKEIDCTYENHFSLYDVGNFINSLDAHKVDIIFKEKGLALDYTGKSNKLLDYIGLEKGIQEVYNKLTNG